MLSDSGSDFKWQKRLSIAQGCESYNQTICLLTSISSNSTRKREKSSYTLIV